MSKKLLELKIKMVKHKCVFWMMSFVSPSKAICPYMLATVLRYLDSNGILRVCGGSDLKSSQHYPKLLGLAVAELFHGHRECVKQKIQSNG